MEETNVIATNVVTVATAEKFNVERYLMVVGDWFVHHIIPIIIILVLTVIVLKGIGVMTDKLATLWGKKKTDPEAEKRAKTLGSVIRWVLRVGILAVAFMMMLGELGIEVGPVLAAAGVVGLAVGFGAQSLVADFITGFFLLLEDQIRVGDVVQINDKGGLVEQINLRMVILRDETGTVHFIRNGKIDVVSNMTKDFSNYVFRVEVSYRENVDEVIAILREIDEEMRKDPAYKNEILAPLEVMGLDSFGESAIVIKAKTKTKPIQQWRVGREFNRRIKIQFDAKNIEIPYPTRTLFIGQDKEGNTRPIRVENSRSKSNGEGDENGEGTENTKRAEQVEKRPG